jgi:hypothetical protein
MLRDWNDRPLFRRLDAGARELAVAASQVSYTDAAQAAAPSGWRVRMETHAIGINYRLHAGNVLPKL